MSDRIAAAIKHRESDRDRNPPQDAVPPFQEDSTRKADPKTLILFRDFGLVGRDMPIVTRLAGGTRIHTWRTSKELKGNGAVHGSGSGSRQM